MSVSKTEVSKILHEEVDLGLFANRGSGRDDDPCKRTRVAAEDQITRSGHCLETAKMDTVTSVSVALECSLETG